MRCFQATIAFLLATLFGGVVAYGDVTVSADDFDGNAVGEPLGTPDWATIVPDPTGAGRGNVLEITLEGGGQWNEIYAAEVPVTPGTNFTVKMDYYAPFESTWDVGDSIGSYFRPNAATPDHSNSQVQEGDATFDEWTTFEWTEVVPDEDNTGAPVTSMRNIFTIRDGDSGGGVNDGGPGVFAWFDNWSIVTDAEDTGSDLICDFDADGQCDIVDLDLLYGAWGTAGAFDVDSNGSVDDGDIGAWLDAASDPLNPYLGGTKTFVIGDVNLDGNVDSTDLGLLLNNFGDTNGLLYGAGNQNDDMDVNSTDLGLLLNNFGATSSSAVPEPTSLAMLLAAVCVIAGLIRKR